MIDPRTVRDADLLGRPETLMDSGQFGDAVTGKRVLILGAGGSIGSAVAERVAQCRADHMTLVTNTEIHLYEIGERLARLDPRGSRTAVLCDVRDAEAVERLMERERPDLVVHAAALKHIPLVEQNPCEGVLTNVMGTANVVDACAARGIQLVFLSTDKAVYPSSVMGATKRAAELYCLEHGGDTTQIARLVNVLGSSGSVVPLWWSMIAEGRAPTVTDPDMARYFVTHREIADFLLHVAGMHGGTAGRGVFVPVLHSQVRILDLAERMVAASGERVGPVVVTGIRPGEKLTESLTYPHETPRRMVSEFAMHAAWRKSSIDHHPADLITAAQAGNTGLVLDLLHDLVPEYGQTARAEAASA